MSVEGGSIGGGVTGAAPVVVNEGPFRGSLEGFKPMNASDINTIDFKGGTVAPSQPSVIAQVEAVAAAAWEKSEPASPPAPPRGESRRARRVNTTRSGKKAFCGRRESFCSKKI